MYSTVLLLLHRMHRTEIYNHSVKTLVITKSSVWNRDERIPHYLKERF